MAEMSRKFREMGGEVYVDADMAKIAVTPERVRSGDQAAVKKSNEALG